MQKIIIFGLMLVGIWQPVQADICFDIANDLIFSEPESPHINPYKYEELLVDLIEKFLPYFQSLSNPTMLEDEKVKEVILLGTYIEDYLTNLGSPEALRLRDDIEKLLLNMVNFAQQNPDLFAIVSQDSKKMRPDQFGIKYKVCKNLKNFQNPYN